MPTTTSEPANIGWVIDRDYINDTGKRVGVGQTRSDAETAGWGSVTISYDLKVGDVEDPVRFRTLDDDGEVYYGGAMSRSWLDGDEEYAFGPLNFATADAGAVDLQYRDENGKWKSL